MIISIKVTLGCLKCLSTSEVYALSRQQLDASSIILERKSSAKPLSFKAMYFILKQCTFLSDPCNGWKALPIVPPLKQNFHLNSNYSYRAMFLFQLVYRRHTLIRNLSIVSATHLWAN